MGAQLLKVRIAGGTPTAAETNRIQDNVGTALNPLLGKLAQSTAWVTVTALLNHWIPYDTTGAYNLPSYRVDMENFVHLRGIVKGDAGGTAAASLTLPVFRLPEALAPLATNIFPIASNNLFGEARVDAQGYVYVAPPSSTTWASLDGITFQVGS